MSLFTLPRDLILTTLEQLDPLSLMNFSFASKAIYDLVHQSSNLRYRYELAICGLKDGPPGRCPPRKRLLSLLAYKRGWPTLTPGAEDKIRIAQPTVVGVSGGHLYHASQNPLAIGFQWVLQVYQLRSFRMAPNSTLSCYSHTVPFEFHKVAIDATQGLMVLAQLYSPIDSPAVVILHLRDLFICQDHPRVPQGRLDFPTDWWGNLPPGQRIGIEQVQICGTLVAVAARLELETREGSTDLIIFNWRHGGEPLCILTEDLLSFDLIHQTRFIIVSQPDPEDSDDSTTWERQSDGLYIVNKPEERCPPCVSVCEISQARDYGYSGTRSYEFPLAWSGIAYMEICPNQSWKDNISPAPETLFYHDPSLRLTAIFVEFKPRSIPTGCSRKIVVVFDQSKLKPMEEGYEDVLWEDWQHHCMVLNLPDRAESVRLCGMRLTFVEVFKGLDPNVAGTTCRVHVLDLNPRMAPFLGTISRTRPPWRWQEVLPSISTIFDNRGSRYVRSSTIDPMNMSWMDTTEDGLVVYDENREGQCHISILTFGKEA